MCVCVMYVRAGMEEMDGDQSYFLQGAMVIAFTSLGFPHVWGKVHLQHGNMCTHVCELTLNRSLPMQVLLH